VFEAPQATGPRVKACEAHPLVCGLFPDVNQTCRPLLAKFPKTAGNRREYPGVVARTLGKFWLKAAKILVKFQERVWGNSQEFTFLRFRCLLNIGII
jgi:hypothetical protein